VGPEEAKKERHVADRFAETLKTKGNPGFGKEGKKEEEQEGQPASQAYIVEAEGGSRSINGQISRAWRVLECGEGV